MPGSEMAHRDRARRSRPVRQARLPIPKPTEGFDRASVSLPDGRGREEMLSLGSVPAAEGLALLGQTGRGETHMATALGDARPRPGIPSGSGRPPGP